MDVAMFAQALPLSVSLIGLAGLIRAGEDWVIRKEYGADGVMSGDIVLLQQPGRPGSVWTALRPLLRSDRVLSFCIVGRLASGAALTVTPWGADHLVGPLLFFNLALLMFSLLRCGYGADGADQMLIIVCTGALLAQSGIPAVRSAGLWFVTGQLVLSFVVAGMAKLSGEEWRSGKAICGILSTERYGMPALAGVLTRHGSLSRLLGWGVIVFEASFFMVLFGVEPLTLAYLGAGLAFHAGVAATMGLNNFLLSFAPAYPLAAMCLAS
ncbi:hypothetical protein [Nonomuraea sp. NPDC001831]|uniref:hypothetical protein n=1 Tax=Nonomuraea sp. NPDC001831 TaxID=3364340 RepID=UPI0036752EF5